MTRNSSAGHNRVGTRAGRFVSVQMANSTWRSESKRPENHPNLSARFRGKSSDSIPMGASRLTIHFIPEQLENIALFGCWGFEIHSDSRSNRTADACLKP